MVTNSTVERIVAVLRKRFPGNEVALEHFGGLLITYAASGLGPPHLISELETGDEGKLWSCIWEAILYRQLHSLGYAFRGTNHRSGQRGPDFCIDQDDKTIWLDATVPAPVGIPPDWLETPVRGNVRARTKPDQERVLRCTTAIAAKRDKFAEDLRKGFIGPHDCTVIAVNICRLSDYDLEGTGISQKPLVMEAVFPLGPLVFSMTREGKIEGPGQHIPRYSLTKPSGTEVPGALFFDPDYANVSAVIQSHQKDVYHKELGSGPIKEGRGIPKVARVRFGSVMEDDHGRLLLVFGCAMGSD